MKLTKDREFFIGESKKLWEDIEKSGESKSMFLFLTPEGQAWLDKEYRCMCPLCEYILNQGDNDNRKRECSPCPLVQKYGKRCFALGYRNCEKPTKEWLEAIRGL